MVAPGCVGAPPTARHSGRTKDATGSDRRAAGRGDLAIGAGLAASLIQPHGYLVGLERDSLRLALRSANLDGVIPGLGFGGSPDWLPAEVVAACRALGREPAGERTMLATIAGVGRVEVHCFADADLVFCEFEAMAAPGDADSMVTLRLAESLRDLAASPTIAALCARTTDGIFRLSGLQRVVLLRFVDDDVDEVVAETTAAGWRGSLLGSRFPSQPRADLMGPSGDLHWTPRQRQAAVPMLQDERRAGHELDLRLSHFRPLPQPVYRVLDRTSADATLSVMLRLGGASWGVVIGQHRKPHRLPLAQRQAIVAIARAFALRLDALTLAQAQDDFLRGSSHYAAFMRKLGAADDILPALMDGAPEITDLFPDCGGAALLWSDDSGPVARSVGLVPDADRLIALGARLRAAADQAVFVQDVLAVFFEDPRQPMLLLFPRQDDTGSAEGDAAPTIWRAADIETAEALRYTINTVMIRIRERKQAKEQLLIAAAAFESQDGIMICDRHHLILRVNRAFTRMTGYSADEVVGRQPRLLRQGRQNAAFIEGIHQDLARFGVWRGEILARRKDGEIYPGWLSVTAVKDEAGTVSHYLAALADITLRKATEEEIRQFAFYDPLTRLANARLLLSRLTEAQQVSARTGRVGALFLLDLDNFKSLNDTLGRSAGDLLLQQMAERLSACIGRRDTLARLGGDEFAILLEQCDDAEPDPAAWARRQEQKVLALVRPVFALPEHAYRCTASIGLTLFNGQDLPAQELLKQAEIAMYNAKAGGRNGLRLFDPDMQAAVTARTSMEAELRQGIRAGQLRLDFQPQVDGAGRWTGAEALVRWHHPERGLIPPGQFIPLAEESGLILPLGLWVLENACQQITTWASDPATRTMTMAVNVSARQFRQPDFVDQVQAVLRQSGADPRRLKLELTESMLLDNIEDIIAKMARLRQLGVQFSLDDFGTGYSSLSYLKRLPLSQLKIDQSFVRDVLTDSNDAAIARTVIALGQSLGLTVIAEGVETDGQRSFLADNGCDAYQGYLFSRPISAAAFVARLRRQAATTG